MRARQELKSNKVKMCNCEIKTRLPKELFEDNIAKSLYVQRYDLLLCKHSGH